MKKIENKTTHKELAWDLKTPCRDCPFRKDVEPHPGVAHELELYFAKILIGEFSHSCHKTDPRSDGFEPGYKGAVQHCAGANILTRKTKEIQTPAFYAEYKKIFNPKKLDMKAPVFNNLIEMANKYKPLRVRLGIIEG